MKSMKMEEFKNHPWEDSPKELTEAQKELIKIADMLLTDEDRRKMEWANFHEQAVELCKLSVLDLCKGKSGFALAKLPNEKSDDGKTRRPGGEVVLYGRPIESGGTGIGVIAAIGPITHYLNEIAKSGTYVSVELLKRKYLNPPSNIPEDLRRQLLKLHLVIRRALEIEQRNSEIKRAIKAERSSHNE